MHAHQRYRLWCIWRRKLRLRIFLQYWPLFSFSMWNKKAISICRCNDCSSLALHHWLLNSLLLSAWLADWEWKMLPIRNFPLLSLRRPLLEAPSEPARFFSDTLIMKPLLRWEDFLFVFVLLAANPKCCFWHKRFRSASLSSSKFGAMTFGRKTILPRPVSFMPN